MVNYLPPFFIFDVNMNKKFLGIIYFIIGFLSLIYGMYYLSETYQTNLELSYERLMFLVPSFVLSGITFYYAVKFLK